MPLILFSSKKKAASSTVIVADLSYDSYWNNVVFLSHFEGSTYTDEKKHTINALGTISRSEAAAKFGSTGLDCTLEGGYLTTPTSTDFILTGEFTVEYWVKLTAIRAWQSMFSIGAYNSGILIRSHAGDNLFINNNSLTGLLIPVDSNWHHVAVTRDSVNMCRVFLDGSIVVTKTITGAVNSTGAGIVLGASSHSFTEEMNGYLDEVRVTNGKARYTSNFIVPTAAFPSSSAPNSEPVWGKTLLLLKGDGITNGQNNIFLDSSTNSLAVTRTGNVAQGIYSPFSIPDGYWGAAFDGNGDYLTSSPNAAFNFGTGDMSIEAWILWDGTYSSTARVLYSTGGSGSLDQFGISSDTGLYFAGTYNNVPSGYPPIGVWTHVAATRAGGLVRVFINGQVVASKAVTSTLGSSTAVPSIGLRIADNQHPWLGAISNLRVVKGTALYTANFNPSSTPLTAVAGTSLLTCQSSRFIDNSENGLTLTAYGNTRIITDTPFNNPNEITTTVGSAYFDGSGDYLSIPNSASATLVGMDATIEFWANFGAVSGTYSVFSHWNNSNYNGYRLEISAGLLRIYVTTTYYLSATVLPNIWYHIAFVKSGSTLKLFVNGVLVSSVTAPTFLTNTVVPMYIGCYHGGGWPFNGYISNFCFTSGVAKYSSNFTPSIVTADANTLLLLNFNNSQVIDSTGRNVVETVSGAKCSSVSATGTGSIYFDGASKLTIPISSMSGITSGDFTIESWIRIGATQANNACILSCGSFAVYFNAAGSISYVTQSVAGISSATVVPLNTWTHFAVCRSGTTVTIFLNGISTISGTIANGANTTQAIEVGNQVGYTRYLTGYLEDLRITKGFVRYATNFVPRMSSLPAKQLVEEGFDPYWNNVVLSMAMEGSSGSTTLKDEKLHIITSAVALSNANTKFGITSLSFLGTTAKTNITKSSTEFYFAADDFTIEFWYNQTTAFGGGQNGIIGANVVYTTSGWWCVRANQTRTNSIGFTTNTGGSHTYVETPLQSITNGVWHHVAVVRSTASGTIKIFIDGVEKTSLVFDKTTLVGSSSTNLVMGDDSGYQGNDCYLNGYIDDLRITKGIARYTNNFAVPTKSNLLQ